MSSPRKGRSGKGRAYSLVAILVLMILALGAALPQSSLAAPGTWSFTGAMSTTRDHHTATLLPAGRVLVTGGSEGTAISSCLASAQLYDPGLGTFGPAGNMGTPRAYHTATLLRGGRVLVAGGTDGVIEKNTAELFNPLSGTFSNTGDMAAARAAHTATLLPNGKVLVAGGIKGDVALANAELYDPLAGNFSSIAHMGAARYFHTATLLPNGKVLVVGGSNGTTFVPSAELYDPVLETWGFTDSPGPITVWHTATLLPNGKVLVVDIASAARLYDPATATWGTTGPMGKPRVEHTAHLLGNGKVLVAGGGTNEALSDSNEAIDIGAELYDPATNAWSATGAPKLSRAFAAATLLANGKVLVAGGTAGLSAYASAELYEPELPPAVKLPPLLAFYPFEGNALDASGNGRHGKFSGVALPQLVAGYEGQAYYFNGTPINITVPLDINPAQYPRLTMGAWAWTGSVAGNQTILSQDNAGFDRALGINEWTTGIGWSAFCGPAGQVLGVVPSILGSWTFVAVSYDQAAQTVKLRVNDMVLKKTGVTLGTGETKLSIGSVGHTPTIQKTFNGTIDNIFVFGDVLTDQQMAYIRTGGAQAISSAARKTPAPFLGLLLD